MIGKVKKWLGIEGVRISIVAPDILSQDIHKVTGVLHLASMREEKVSHIAVRLKEQYQRGRWKDKRVSEFVLGEMIMEGPFLVLPEEITEVPFELPFEWMLSEMDRMQQKNVLYRSIVSAAKWVKGVESIYWLEAEARVKGTVLDAFAKKFLRIG